jgi:hypothetical protein
VATMMVYCLFPQKQTFANGFSLHFSDATNRTNQFDTFQRSTSIKLARVCSPNLPMIETQTFGILLKRNMFIVPASVKSKLFIGPQVRSPESTSRHAIACNSFRLADSLDDCKILYRRYDF